MALEEKEMPSGAEAEDTAEVGASEMEVPSLQTRSTGRDSALKNPMRWGRGAVLRAPESNRRQSIRSWHQVLARLWPKVRATLELTLERSEDAAHAAACAPCQGYMR